MKSGDIIKHIRALDIAILLTEDPVLQKGNGLLENHYIIKGLWMNQGFDSSYMVNPKEDYGKVSTEISENEWLICENPKAKCVRYEKWSPILCI